MEVQPSQLLFEVPEGEPAPVSREIEVHNRNCSPMIYFKIKTTCPKNFSVRPPEGRLGLGEMKTVKVTLRSPDGLPGKRPRFQVRAIRCEESEDATPPGDLWDQAFWEGHSSIEGSAHKCVIDCRVKAASEHGTSPFQTDGGAASKANEADVVAVARNVGRPRGRILELLVKKVAKAPLAQHEIDELQEIKEQFSEADWKRWVQMAREERDRRHPTSSEALPKQKTDEGATPLGKNQPGDQANIQPGAFMGRLASVQAHIIRSTPHDADPQLTRETQHQEAELPASKVKDVKIPSGNPFDAGPTDKDYRRLLAINTELESTQQKLYLDIANLSSELAAEVERTSRLQEQRAELEQKIEQQEQKINSYEEALKLDQLTRKGDYQRGGQTDQVAIRQSMHKVTGGLQGLRRSQMETRAVISVCLKALREDMSTFVNVIRACYEHKQEGTPTQAPTQAPAPTAQYEEPVTEGIPVALHGCVQVWCVVTHGSAQSNSQDPTSKQAKPRTLAAVLQASPNLDDVASQIRIRDGRTISVEQLEGSLAFEFDHTAVQSPMTDSNDSSTLNKWLPLVHERLKGGGIATMVSFGGADGLKTEILEGTSHRKGLVTRTVHQIFDVLGLNAKVSISAVEVHDGQARDLLGSTSNVPTAQQTPIHRLEIDTFGQRHITNTASVRLHDANDFDRVFGILSGRRLATADSTSGAPLAHHSCAHCIICITVTDSRKNSSFRNETKLYFVEVAAIESHANSELQGLSNINDGRESASRDAQALGDMIGAVAAGRMQLQYKHTQLTQILQEALGVDATITCLFNVPASPAQGTVDLLLYASLLKSDGFPEPELHRKSGGQEETKPAFPIGIGNGESVQMFIAQETRKLKTIPRAHNLPSKTRAWR